MSFTFGENWSRYSSLLDERRVLDAEKSVQALLQRRSLHGRSFLDIGAGSGLFSIAAARLGAIRVIALDRDPNCISTIQRNMDALLPPALKSRVEIQNGDILRLRAADVERYDIVYAWGSLHHTGSMWTAIDNSSAFCARGGLFAVALYNDCRLSPFWLHAKQLYHVSPAMVRTAMVASLTVSRLVARMITGKHPWRVGRGMSVWYDAIDWLGGLPYEYASPEQVNGFLSERNFTLVHSNLTSRSGCNEFLFRRAD